MLPEDGATKVRILDLQGRTVATLGDGWMSAGAHEFEWNGKNNSGTDLASGVCFLKVAQGARTKMKKLTLLK